MKVKLTEEDVAELRILAENAHRSMAARWPETHMNHVLVETPSLTE